MDGAAQPLLSPLSHRAHAGRSAGGAAAITPEERRAIAEAETVYDYDDRFIAPRNGFAGSADYYARCSAGAYLGGIAVPTLVVHALDDPWIPSTSYREVDWAGLPRLTPLLPRFGGHVGFHGIGSRVPWHDRCLATFFDRLSGRASAN